MDSLPTTVSHSHIFRSQRLIYGIQIRGFVDSVDDLRAKVGLSRSHGICGCSSHYSTEFRSILAPI